MPGVRRKKMVISSLLATFVVVMSVSQPWNHRTEILGSILLPELPSALTLQNPDLVKGMIKKKNASKIKVLVDRKKIDEVLLSKLGLEIRAPEFEKDPSLFDYLGKLLTQKPLQAELILDHENLESYLGTLKTRVEEPAEKPKVTWSSRKGWHYQGMKKGIVLDDKSLQNNLPKLVNDLQKGVEIPMLQLKTKRNRAQMSQAERQRILSQLASVEKLIEKKVTVMVKDQERALDLNASPEYITLSSQGAEINEAKIQEWANEMGREFYKDPGHVRIIGKKEIRKGVYKAEIEGEQVFGEGINSEELLAQVLEALKTPERKVMSRLEPIPFTVYSDLEQTPYDILSKGYSDYSTGNKPDRVYNFSLGLKRISNTLIDRGQEISFNKALGGIDGEFKQGLSIMGTATVPVLGGGICQASTTFFRAIANLGVPIKMHKSHSWDLSYYRKGGYGLDATIFPEQGLDVKGVNDIDSQLFLYAYTRPEVYEAYVLIYGKGDGRKVTLTPEVEYKYAPGPKTIKWIQLVELPSGELRQHEIVSRYKK